MRIDELVPYKSNPQIKDIQDILNSKDSTNVKFVKIKRYLASIGFKELGSGSFATVFEHPTYPWVFKFFKADPAYEYFLDYALKNQDNPNIVKIRGRWIKLGNKLCMARIEKLNQIGSDHAVWEFIKAFSLYNSQHEQSNAAEALAIPAIKNGSEQYPGIWKVITELNPKPLGFRWDINIRIFGDDNNIMLRGSTPVITDPLAIGS